MIDLLLHIQDDMEGRLLAESYFDEIPIIVQRKGVTANEIQKLLGVVNKRSGKAGAIVLILQPAGGVPSPNVPGPSLALTLSCVVLVHPTINESLQGTKKTSEIIALRVLQLFHLVELGYGRVLTARDDAVVPNDSFDGLVGYQVNFHTEAGPVSNAKVPTPMISADSELAPATITITEVLSGADIWYTTDDSYPSSHNTNALLYSAPFSQATGARIRAAAEKTGYVQSNVRQLMIADAGTSGPSGFSSGFSPGFGS